MRLVLDACVLYPSIMRSLLIAAARAGVFQPLWSPRILEEWRRAVAHQLPDQAQTAEAEIALLVHEFPNANKDPLTDPSGLWLPDENDLHVLGIALDHQADGIVTLNRKDFPRSVMQKHGLDRVEPDLLLKDAFLTSPQTFAPHARRVIDRALRDLPDMTERGILKKARLPRFAKAWGAAATSSSGMIK